MWGSLKVFEEICWAKRVTGVLLGNPTFNVSICTESIQRL